MLLTESLRRGTIALVAIGAAVIPASAASADVQLRELEDPTGAAGGFAPSPDGSRLYFLGLQALEDETVTTIAETGRSVSRVFITPDGAARSSSARTWDGSRGRG